MDKLQYFVSKFLFFASKFAVIFSKKNVVDALDYSVKSQVNTIRCLHYGIVEVNVNVSLAVQMLLSILL